jgi:hypothetical protein
MVLPFSGIPAISLLPTRIYSFGRYIFTLKRLFCSATGELPSYKLQPNRPLTAVGGISSYAWYHGKNQCWMGI